MEWFWNRLSAEMFSLGNLKLAAAIALIVLLRLVLQPGDRRLLRLPAITALLYVLCVVIDIFVPEPAPPRAGETPAVDWPYVIGLFFLLISLGRSLFLLLVHSFFGRRTQPLPKIFRDIIQGLVYAGIAIIVLRAAGVEPGSLLTTSALLTAVIGLSLQDTLGNMFAGLAIQAQRPFEVGDWIQFDQDREHIGHVLEINWRATKVLTNDQIEVTVPNATLAKAPIVNYSRPKPMVRRSVFVTGPYDVPPHRIRETILAALGDVPSVLVDPPPTVVTHEFADSGVQYWVRFFTNDFQLRDIVQGAVRDRIWYALDRAGITIPYPIRDVRMTHVTAEHLERDEALKIDKREKALKKVDFLAALSDEQRRNLATRSKSRIYTAGENILRQGEAGQELFILQKGEVAVLLDRGNGSGEVEVARLAAGKFFGEMGLMTGEKRRATVRAVRDCETTVVGKAAFQDVLEVQPELAEAISKVLAERDFALGELASAGLEARKKAAEQNKSVLLDRIKEFFSL